MDRSCGWLRLGLVLGFFWGAFLLGAQTPERVRLGVWPLAEPSARSLRDGTAQVRAARPDVLVLTGLRDRVAAEALASSLRAEGYQLLVCTEFAAVEGTLGQAAVLARRSAFGAWSEAWKGDGGPVPAGGFAFAAFRLSGMDLCVYAVAESEQGPADRGGERARQLARHVAAVERRLNTPNRSFAILGNAFLGEQAPLAEGGFMVLAEVTSGRVREGDRAVSEALLGRNLTASSGRGRLTAPAFFEVAHTGFVPRGSLPNSRTPWWSREAVYYGGAAVFGTVMVGWLAMRVMRRRSLGLSGPQLVRLNPRSDLWAPADLGPTEAVESPSRAEASGGGTPEASSALAVRENLVPHLARLVKDRILWTLIRQRRQMLRTQDLSSQRVMALEQRLALLQSQLARQTRAYEDRIRELEGEVARLREQPRG